MVQQPVSKWSYISHVQSVHQYQYHPFDVSVEAKAVSQWGSPPDASTHHDTKHKTIFNLRPMYFISDGIIIFFVGRHGLFTSIIWAKFVPALISVPGMYQV